MLFNSWTFLILLTVTFPLYYLPVSGMRRKVWQVTLLLTASAEHGDARSEERGESMEQGDARKSREQGAGRSETRGGEALSKSVDLLKLSLLASPCSRLPARVSLLASPCSRLPARVSLLASPCSRLLARVSLLKTLLAWFLTFHLVTALWLTFMMPDMASIGANLACEI